MIESIAVWGLLLAFLFGLLVGSFLNVVIHRIPVGESIVFPSSHCPRCGEALKWYHNIPLLSWLFLHGKCAYCYQPISVRYPIVELLNALIWTVLYLKIGWHLEFIFVAMSFSALLALSVIDFDYFAVPDSVNFFALGMALIAPFAKVLEGGSWDIVLDTLKASAVAAFGLWALAWVISKVAKKEAMGSADVIVAGTMAALLGLSHFFVAMFVSAILAIIPSVFAKDTMVPFVPFLASATIIVYIFDTEVDSLLHWIMYG